MTRLPTGIITILLLIPAFGYGQDISYPCHRFGTGPLVIIAGAELGTDQKFNPCWQGIPLDRMIVTRNYWIPYPADWNLTDNNIKWCIAAYAMMWKGLPIYFQFDFDADGHVDASDLAVFESEYGTKWDQSDFAMMGLVYGQRSLHKGGRP